MMSDTQFYVGSQNDALFIIDQPPRPAPVDYMVPGNPRGVRVVAKMCDNDKRASEEAEMLASSGNQVVRLTKERNVLREALNNISGLTPIQNTDGRTNWVETCGAMRIIAAKALASTSTGR